MSPRCVCGHHAHEHTRDPISGKRGACDDYRRDFRDTCDCQTYTPQEKTA